MIRASQLNEKEQENNTSETHLLSAPTHMCNYLDTFFSFRFFFILFLFIFCWLVVVAVVVDGSDFFSFHRRLFLLRSGLVLFNSFEEETNKIEFSFPSI